MKRSKDDTMATGAAAVAQAVRGLIQKNNLEAGDRLPTHAELSRQLGIGARRLREGLSILDEQGLIVTRRKGGTLVREPSPEVLDDAIGWQLDWRGCTFEDVVRARAALEGAIAAEAARTRTARDLLVMLDAVEQMEALTDAGRGNEGADEAFHLAVLAATRNPTMEVFGQLIRGQFRRKARKHLTASRRRQAAGVGEHRAVLAAIEDKQADQAREHMRDHVLRQLKDRRGRTKTTNKT